MNHDLLNRVALNIGQPEQTLARNVELVLANARTNRILNHYSDQIHKGRLSTSIATMYALDDIAGKHRH